jgi:hypothetical protein
MMSNNLKPTSNKEPMTQQKPLTPNPSSTFPSTVPNPSKGASRPPLPPGPPPNNNPPPPQTAAPPQQTQMNPFSSPTPLSVIKTEIVNVKQELGIENTASHSAGPMAKGSPHNSYSLPEGVQIKQEKEKHKKKKKEKHKDKDKERHKEKKHKNKDKKKDKKKDKERGDKKHQQHSSDDHQLTPPLSQPLDGQQRENLKIKLTLKKPDLHHSSSSSSNNSKKNANLRS